jgi:predicted CXXCH cytochrome family protein
MLEDTMPKFGFRVTAPKQLILAAVAIGVSLPSFDVSAETKEGCVARACHQQLGRQAFVHTPVAKGVCAECHPVRADYRGGKHVQGQIGTAKPRWPLCKKCHAKMAPKLKHAVSHRPVDKVSCGFCHEAHGAGERFLLRSFGKRKKAKYDSFCFSCHKERIFAGKVKHEPAVKGRKCANCHLVHGSEHKSLLAKSQEQVCLGCHRVAWVTRSVVHGPVAAGLCTACHDPHSGVDKQLLTFNRDKLCLSCHKAGQLGPRHKTVVKDKKKKCVDCHEVHAADKPYLLKDSGK